ncbi:MAG: hypothetical protein AB1796_03555 [Bacillota bacterium]
MRPVKGPVIITIMLLLLVVAPLCFIAACSINKQKPAIESEKELTETKAGEEQEKVKPFPQIGPLLFDPVAGVDASGVVLIGEKVKVSVEAPGAWKVEFYAAPAAEQNLGVLFWDDDHPEDGWGTSWEPPLAGEVFRLTAVARFDGEAVQNSAVVLWPKAAAEPVPASSETGKPFIQLCPQSGIKEVDGLPRYFQAGGWVDGHTIFGLAGTTPVLYNLETGESSSPGVTAWEARLSPEKERISYTQEKGVYVARIDGKDKIHLWPRETAGMPEGEGNPRGGLWSPGGEKLLVWWEHEWDCEFYVCELQKEEVGKINTRLDGYFLTSATGWADEQKLIFTTRANIMKDGTREYTFGYRSDVAVYDLETLSLHLITNTADGEFIEGLSAGPEGILFLRWFTDRDVTSYGVMDPTGRVIWEEPFYENMNFFLAPDGRTVACLVETGRQEMNIVYELVIRSQGVSRSILEMQMANHILPEIFWHPDGKKLLFTFIAAVPREDPLGNYQESYYTLIIEP